ncbi:MAG: hypothetical protein ACRYG2_17730 [Janthinobacterium lividum]
MRTLLAFSFRVPVPQRVLQAASSRVEQWYRPLWGLEPRTDCCAGPSRGLLMWSDPDEPCRWPGWVDGDGRVVATLHAPLGHEVLTGPGPLADAPVRLADRLRERPDELRLLTPPFVLATYERAEDSLTLQTDLFGLGRLFELETPEVTVWSNRPVAALRFAGVRAEADPLAWRRMAGCDWPMGAATPYLGVEAVGGATRIVVGARGPHRRTTDVLGQVARGRPEPLGEASLQATAAALTAAATSVAALWPGTPTLSLSGGRDSRLVAAAFLAAGVGVRFTTYAGAAGEAATAEELLARLPGPVDHRVPTQAPGPRTSAGPGALTRAREWHDMTEGLRPALYLRGPAPRTVPGHRRPLVCGVGGEFGHAPGYPDDVEEIERLPPGRRLDAFTRSLHAKITLPCGPSRSAGQAVSAQIAAVLKHAAAHDVTDAKALDWFYADERLRRWGMNGESTGRVMPLLVPTFVEACFGLTTAQSRDSALHTALIDRLVPGWAGVPYFTATLRERARPTHQRLWHDPEADLLAGLIEHEDTGDWSDGFDTAQVRAIWRRVRRGRPAARDELLLQRVVWRAGFSDHLAAVNGDRPTPHRPGTSDAGGRAVDRRVRPLHRLAVRANDVPLARRLARTALGRRLRGLLGV